jgi:hypothetical protein
MPLGLDRSPRRQRRRCPERLGRLRAGGDRLLRRPRALRRGTRGGLARGAPRVSVHDARGPRVRVSLGRGLALRDGLRGGGQGGRRVGRRRARAALPADVTGDPAGPSWRRGRALRLRRARRRVPGRHPPRLRCGGATVARPRGVPPRVRVEGRHLERPWRLADPRWSRRDPVCTSPTLNAGRASERTRSEAVDARTCTPA